MFKVEDKTIAILVFILIISGNYIGQLFPCNVQAVLSESMIMKHVFGFLTLFFFVLLTLPNFTVTEGTQTSLILYFIFLIFSKTHYVFWFLTVFIFSIVYFIYLYKRELKDDDPFKSQLNRLNTYLSYLGALVGIIGFLVYMGMKKNEYGKNFKYMQFLLGKPDCKGKSPKLSLTNALLMSFS